jgi:hypothetical protein
MSLAPKVFVDLVGRSAISNDIVAFEHPAEQVGDMSDEAAGNASAGCMAAALTLPAAGQIRMARMGHVSPCGGGSSQVLVYELSSDMSTDMMSEIRHLP